MGTDNDDQRYMSQALELARRGRGSVEPNPQVGCVIVRDDKIVGEGWHQQFGGPHAEVNALAVAGDLAKDATAYVTLEPCCHQGKTPPCSKGLINAGIKKVVVGCTDPNPQVAGTGIQQLREAGIEVVENVLQELAAALIAPFAKLMTQQRPWVVAKWAMTLDGKIASHTGSSQWISGEQSRAVVHRLRGYMDGILVGSGTLKADDPLLTARPPGPRKATRIVLDSKAEISPSSNLLTSTDEAPVLVCVSEAAPADRITEIEKRGAEVLTLSGDDHAARLASLLDELGHRQMTNLMIEGGGDVMGTLFDLGEINEVHAFIASKLIGGQGAKSPIAGVGLAEMPKALKLQHVTTEILGEDVYVSGVVKGSPKL